MKPIFLYDTTLRDGTQGENITFTAEEKVRIAKKLDDTGIHYIEGGWPGSNPRDKEFFKLGKKTVFKQARLSAFSSTRRPGITPENDLNLRAIIESETPVAAIFGKTWALHVKKLMNNTLDENLSMIYDSIFLLKNKGLEVIYDAEHFFDGYKDNPDYALKTLMAAIDGGADALVFCDTNGGTLPFEIESILTKVDSFIANTGRSICLGIHTHNDCGMAVANTITAVRAGAKMIQGTINGYGERCGNADLISIIPILKIKMGCPCISDENLKKLKNLSRFVSETANMTPLSSRPFVGKSAFAHKAGIHVSAIMKESRGYEHINPELVGNSRRVLVSDLSGKSNVEYKAKELNVDLGEKGSKELADEIKKLEQQGFEFDGADGSLKIFMEKYTGHFKPAFELESFRVSIEKNKDQPCSAHATIKISVEGQEEITAAEGDGPISALDNALRKALDKFFPNIDSMYLVDFKVRVIDGRSGSKAKVRVLIDSRDQDNIWSTIGVSEDIIEASWQALADSFYYKLKRLKNGAGFALNSTSN
ncbi:(R)-citramalate synthase [Candidatus Magnetomoraceae bacterium gMMP-15]